MRPSLSLWTPRQNLQPFFFETLTVDGHSRSKWLWKDAVPSIDAGALDAKRQLSLHD
jgi:hypothetical protein